jgi:RNA polymerase sigma-70 factor (ECF subfamily)
MVAMSGQVQSQSSEQSPHAEHEAVRFESSVRPLLEGLRGAALRLTRNPHDADDLLQETTMRAWRFWSHYEPGSNLRAWLHRILVNTFVNSYRRARRERELVAQLQRQTQSATPEAQNAEPQSVRASLSDELHEGLSELPPEFRAVLWAVAVDELSYREAAESLGCPVGTIMSRLHRARRLLQDALRPAAAELKALSSGPVLCPGTAGRAA